MVLGSIGWIVASAWAGPAPPAEASAAMRAIQQASDPSAVVAAYANGVATDRNDPKLYEAYVSRMVDLGLPELAYHQAQTLTTLESNSGLAWGVVAYADARRGEMPDAITAINLAGQAAPSNPFVQRTAGEIVAWYDIKADQSKLPANAKDGLAKVRALLEKQAAFTAAYNTAKDAYQAQAKAAQEPSQAAPSQYQYGSAPQSQPQGDQIAPLGYTASPLPTYYSDYYYDGGPGWIEPAPWWWWQPVGFFAGFDFFPFSTVIVFDHHHFFHHHDFFVHDHFFFHNHAFFHDQFFHHNGLNVAFHGPNSFFFGDGKSAFFGTAARPNTLLALSLRANFHTASSFASSRVLINPPARPSSMPGMNGFATPGTSPHGMPMSRGFAGSGFHGGMGHGGMGFAGGSHGGGGAHGGHR